jgi:hypothetical protein
MAQRWEHEDRMLAANFVTSAEWAVLLTAGYYIPVSKGRFIRQAAWESRAGRTPSEGDLEEHEIAAALEACLSNGWVQLTKQGHAEKNRTLLGVYTGVTTIYPNNGIVLTETGHEVHKRVATAIFGREYFASEPICDPPITVRYNRHNP